MSKLSVPMPRRLRTKTLFQCSKAGHFRPCDDCCGLGYLYYHLIGLRPKGPIEDHDTFFRRRDMSMQTPFRVLEKLLGEDKMDEFDTYANENDNLPDVKSRLDLFRKKCKEAGIEIIERTSTS